VSVAISISMKLCFVSVNGPRETYFVDDPRVLHLVGVEEIRWDRGGTEPAGKYTFFYGTENERQELGTGFFVHKRIISAVKMVEIVRDRPN
jgi:hypothetical protein